ncbi:putative retrotransposon hot spot (RHS) protein, partial [Trypanosoma cruzi]
MPGNQASAVPQGDRQRRARSESEDVTDQPAATRRRVEEARRPQWTMSSAVKDILLEGSTLSTNMKLNDFLWNYVGGRAAVGEDSNVTMQVFVQDPEMFIKNEILLRIITTLPSYSELEKEMKRELEERKILLEANNKFHDEGVDSLEQWRDYEEKDTVTPAARRKLNAVLIQVLREERREAEKRARWDQQQVINLSAKVEDVLFKGSVRVKDMQLNDFLTMELDGMGIVATNWNVLLKEFFIDPTRYIRDAGVLNEIRATGAYARMEKTVREEMGLEEEVRKLHDNGVNNVLGWSKATEEVKATVCENTKNSLDAALEDARKPTTTIEAIKLEGYYESVYNARWHHVMEVSDSKGTVMEVKEGKPPQSWTYRAVGNTLEKKDAVQQSGKAPPRLMVLTSDNGWPYTWGQGLNERIHDCYVNCEVDRVWQIIKGDLNGWLSSHGKKKTSPDPFVLVGTPGIGKSMAAGSYLLYQLLHCDAEQLPMVAYSVAEQTFLFDKIAKMVSLYTSEVSILSILGSFSRRGVKGYIIYDVALKGHQPPAGLPCEGWGMIVVTSPNKNNYESWAKLVGAEQIIINCPEENDVRAICIWKERNGQVEKEPEEEAKEEADYWKKVKERIDKVGPLLRYVFDQHKYKSRFDSCESKVNSMNLFDTYYYSILGTNEVCDDSHSSHKL